MSKLFLGNIPHSASENDVSDWMKSHGFLVQAVDIILDKTGMRLAFILILLGYGTKAGIAPMHTWKPDAYSEAPVPSAALLSSAMLNCACSPRFAPADVAKTRSPEAGRSSRCTTKTRPAGVRARARAMR